MWKCGYRYLSCEKLHKICQLVPTLQIREQLVNICFFSAVSCSFLNASIHFLWTLNYAMTEYRVILLTANFSICVAISALHAGTKGFPWTFSSYMSFCRRCSALQCSLTRLGHMQTEVPPLGYGRIPLHTSPLSGWSRT